MLGLIPLLTPCKKSQYFSCIFRFQLCTGVIININQAATVSTVVTANEGHPVTLNCTDEESGLYNNVRWFKPEGQLILHNKPLTGPWHDEDRATIEEDLSLRIYSVSVGDSGVYTCKTYLFEDEHSTVQVELQVHGETYLFNP